MSSNAATGDSVLEASAVKPGGGSKTVSRWLIQHCCSSGRPSSSVPPPSRSVSSAAAELAGRRLLDPAAELVDHRLHPVTDAQHRDPELEQLLAQRRRPSA